MISHDLLGRFQQDTGDEAEAVAQFLPLAQDFDGVGHLRGGQWIEGVPGRRRLFLIIRAL
jgi:hypothetical protein